MRRGCRRDRGRRRRPDAAHDLQDQACSPLWSSQPWCPRRQGDRGSSSPPDLRRHRERRPATRPRGHRRRHEPSCLPGRRRHRGAPACPPDRPRHRARHAPLRRPDPRRHHAPTCPPRCRRHRARRATGPGGRARRHGHRAPTVPRGPSSSAGVRHSDRRRAPKGKWARPRHPATTRRWDREVVGAAGRRGGGVRRGLRRLPRPPTYRFRTPRPRTGRGSWSGRARRGCSRFRWSPAVPRSAMCDRRGARRCPGDTPRHRGARRRRPGNRPARAGEPHAARGARRAARRGARPARGASAPRPTSRARSDPRTRPGSPDPRRDHAPSFIHPAAPHMPTAQP